MDRLTKKVVELDTKGAHMERIEKNGEIIVIR
jgi:hypothetical protein